MGLELASAPLMLVAPTPGQAPCGGGRGKPSLCNRVLWDGDELTQGSLRNIR